MLLWEKSSLEGSEHGRFSLWIQTRGTRSSNPICWYDDRRARSDFPSPQTRAKLVLSSSADDRFLRERTYDRHWSGSPRPGRILTVVLWGAALPYDRWILSAPHEPRPAPPFRCIFSFDRGSAREGAPTPVLRIDLMGRHPDQILDLGPPRVRWIINSPKIDCRRLVFFFPRFWIVSYLNSSSTAMAFIDIRNQFADDLPGQIKEKQAPNGIDTFCEVSKFQPLASGSLGAGSPQPTWLDGPPTSSRVRIWVPATSWIPYHLFRSSQSTLGIYGYIPCQLFHSRYSNYELFTYMHMVISIFLTWWLHKYKIWSVLGIYTGELKYISRELDAKMIKIDFPASIIIQIRWFEV